MKVVARKPFVGSYPSGEGEFSTITQVERRTKANGEIYQVEIGYITIQARIAVSGRASEADVLDDRQRVAAGGESWVTGVGESAVINRPGEVRVGFTVYRGKFAGENPEFDLPDSAALGICVRLVRETDHIILRETAS